MTPADETLTAIATQHKLTYGLNRSPIRAARQNVPRGLHHPISEVLKLRDQGCVFAHPALFRSSHAGKTPCRYVQEQMKSKTTMRRVWNLRIPSILMINRVLLDKCPANRRVTINLQLCGS
jgi:hypothetical protein